MKHQFTIGALVLAMASGASAQLATSHKATAVVPPPQAASAPIPAIAQSPLKPVVRVDGVVLTNRDLLREMFALFPYARLHNGFPKEQEPGIRQGALQMIIFEELVYQEATRLKMAIAPERVSREERKFRLQFKDQAEFSNYLNVDMDGSEAKLRQQIKRSLLIEAMLKREVENKSAVTLNEARLSYTSNAKTYEHGELFTIQTISIIPPANANPETLKEAASHAESIYKQAKATKNYGQFGLLAEKESNDDYHVDMGDRKAVAAEKLPPEIVKALHGMKPGEVSGLIKLGTAFTILRMNAYAPAGKTRFETVRVELTAKLQKEKYEKLRVALGNRLRKNAKIEEL
jgi:parvulin-like peptidyl-prolyl isomerase